MCKLETRTLHSDVPYTVTTEDRRLCWWVVKKCLPQHLWRAEDENGLSQVKVCYEKHSYSRCNVKKQQQINVHEIIFFSPRAKLCDIAILYKHILNETIAQRRGARTMRLKWQTRWQSSEEKLRHQVVRDAKSIVKLMTFNLVAHWLPDQRQQCKHSAAGCFIAW